MSRTRPGPLGGLALGFAAAFGGFAAFLLVGALGTLGCLVGRRADGALDPADLLRRGGRR